MQLRLFLLATLASLLSLTAIAQSDFEGTISYSIEYLKVPSEVEGMEGMLPSDMTMQFKDARMRLEQQVMGGSQVVVANSATNESFILMDMMGQKIVIPIPAEEVAKQRENQPKPKVTELEGKRTIAGYKCSKAEVTQADGSKVEIWYTKALGKIRHNEYKDLDGFPLEYTATAGGMTTRIKATKVEKEEVAGYYFEVPEGYTEMSQEELMRMGQ